MRDGLCEFVTQTPKGALSQPARWRSGAGMTRYKMCSRKATQTIEVDGRTVRCCGQHKRLNELYGWKP